MLFARMTTQPDATRKSHINTLIVALKAAGVWAKLDAFYAMAAHDAQAAQRNWKQDLYNLTPVNSPTFTADRGYAGDGSSSYLSTNFNPATASSPNYVQDSATLAVRTNNVEEINSSVAGFYDGTKGTTIAPRAPTDTGGVRINQAAVTAGTSTTGRGLFTATRSGSANLKLVRDTTTIVSSTIVSTTVANGALRLGGITAALFATHQMSAALIGSNLSDAEIAALHAALSNYLTAIGIT